MLWFNEERRVGALATEDGTRLTVRGEDFVDGVFPVGRCAGLEVVFDVEDDRAVNVAVELAQDVRRARQRRSSMRL